jgi:uncharacterized protein YciI
LRHWTYSQDLLTKKIVIFAGRTLVMNEDSFAIVVIQTSPEKEARAIMEGDPAVKGGLFRVRLLPYQPMLIGAWPEQMSTRLDNSSGPSGSYAFRRPLKSGWGR